MEVQKPQKAASYGEFCCFSLFPSFEFYFDLTPFSGVSGLIFLVTMARVRLLLGYSYRSAKKTKVCLLLHYFSLLFYLFFHFSFQSSFTPAEKLDGYPENVKNRKTSITFPSLLLFISSHDFFYFLVLLRVVGIHHFLLLKENSRNIFSIKCAFSKVHTTIPSIRTLYTPGT